MSWQDNKTNFDWLKRQAMSGEFDGSMVKWLQKVEAVPLKPYPYTVRFPVTMGDKNIYNDVLLEIALFFDQAGGGSPRQFIDYLAEQLDISTKPVGEVP